MNSPHPTDQTQDDPDAPQATAAGANVSPRLGLSAALEHKSGDVAGRYRVTSRHAQGGLGRILLAQDTRLGRPVAIKEGLKQGLGAEARFLEEARITAGLEHPGIVPVHDVGRWPEGEPFYVMKFVEGRPFKQVLQECRTLESRLTLVPNVLAVVDAMSYPHSRRVVHLDIKPSNILVGQHGETVVVDWGMARDLETLEDGSTAAVVSAGGTPAYMAPEQAAGGEVDARTDVYALGAVLYELLTGRPPYIGGPDTVVGAVLAGPPPRAQTLQPGIPRDLLAILAKAMARNPAQRYPTAAALGADVRAFQNGQIVSARTYAPWVLVARWVRRRLAVVGVVATATALLTVVGATSVARVVEARNEAQLRARALTLVEARNVVLTDPTLTLAWLRTLGDALPAPLAAQVQDLALQAVGSGVARDVWQLPQRNPSALMFTADGKTLVVTTMDAALAGTSVRALDVERGRFTAQAVFPGLVRGVTLRPNGTIHMPELPGANPPLFDEGWLQGRMAPEGAACVPRAGLWRAEAAPGGSVRVMALAAGEGRTLAVPGDVAMLACERSGTALAVVLRDGRVAWWKPGRSKLEVLDLALGKVTAAAFDAAGKLWLGLARAAVVVVEDVGNPGHAPVLLAGRGERPIGWLLPHPKQPGVLAVTNVDGALWLSSVGASAGPLLLDHGVVSARWVAQSPVLVAGTESGETLVFVDGALEHRLPGMAAPVSQVAITLDGTRAASAGEDGEVRLFELGRAPKPLATGKGPMGAVGLAAAHDGVPWVLGRDGALTAGSDAAQALGQPAGVTHPGPGGWCAVGLQDGRVAVLGAAPALDRADVRPLRVLLAHRGPPVVSALAPDGAVWAGAATDGTLQVMDVANGRLLRTLPLGIPPLALAPALDRQGVYVLQGDGTLVFVAGSGTGISRLATPDTTAQLGAVTAGVAAATKDGTLHLLAKDGTVLATVAAHPGPLHHLAVSPQGDVVVTAGMDQTLALWRVEPAALTLLSRLPSDLTALSFAGHAGRLAVGDRAGLVRLVDSRDGQVIHTWRLTDAVAALALTSTALHAVARSGTWQSFSGVEDVAPPVSALLATTRARIQALGRLASVATVERGGNPP